MTLDLVGNDRTITCAIDAATLKLMRLSGSVSVAVGSSVWTTEWEECCEVALPASVAGCLSPDSVVLLRPRRRHPRRPCSTATPIPSRSIKNGLGKFTRPISSTNKEAQAFFDQGFQMMYAFAKPEAVRSFREAWKRDPTARSATGARHGRGDRT